MGNAQVVLDELREPTRSLRAASPGAWAGFASLHDAAMVDGAVPRRTKELIALSHRRDQGVRRVHRLARQRRRPLRRHPRRSI